MLQTSGTGNSWTGVWKHCPGGFLRIRRWSEDPDDSELPVLTQMELSLSSFVVIDLILLEALSFDRWVPLSFALHSCGPFALHQDRYVFCTYLIWQGIHADTHAVRSKQPEIQAMLPQPNQPRAVPSRPIRCVSTCVSHKRLEKDARESVKLQNTVTTPAHAHKNRHPRVDYLPQHSQLSRACQLGRICYLLAACDPSLAGSAITGIDDEVIRLLHRECTVLPIPYSLLANEGSRRPIADPT